MTTAPKGTPDSVLNHLTEALGGATPVLTSTVEDRLADGSLIRKYTAYAEGVPNKAVAVALSASGELLDPAAADRLAGRRLFVPEFEVGDLPHVPPREPVTIDPPRNDWTLNKCDRATETITVTVPPTGVAAKADVYLLADTTGSMQPVLDAVIAGSEAILSHPGLAGFDVAWGVGNYRDFPIPESSSYAFQHQLSPTTNHAPVTAAINTWTALDGQGLDLPEGQFFALHQLATNPSIGWRTDSKRIVVWFGDAPGHDPICTDLTGLAAALTEASVTADLIGAEITVVAVSTTTGDPQALDGDPVATSTDYGSCPKQGSPGQATRIAAATNGSHTSGVDPDSIVATLGPLIASAVASTGNVSLVPTGQTAEFVESITPPGGYGPLKGDEEHVLTFEVTWLGTKACQNEPQVYTGTIDVVADGVVVAAKRVRVTVPACRYHYSVEMICGSQPDRGHDDHDDHDEHDEHRTGSAECGPVVPGEYATAVTIYNPFTCTATVVKSFAPLVVDGKVIGREPETQPARPFAKLELRKHEATMDDCCSLDEALGGRSGDQLTFGVLDIVSDQPLRVTATHTARSGVHGGGVGITSRDIAATRAP
jgi:hypothetical protein